MRGTMNHSFNVSLACDLGVLAATIFNSIGFWVDHNRANGKNFHDGRYWTYNTVSAWAEQFPYASKKQVYTALRKLCDSEYVTTGNYNQNPYDRTLWYSLTAKGEAVFYGRVNEDITPEDSSILPTGKMENPEREVLNTDTKPDEKPDSIPYAEIVDYLNAKTGRRYRCVEATKRLIRGRFGDGYTLDDFKRVIDNMCAERMGTDMEKYLRPATLFAASHFDDYLNWKVQPTHKEDGNVNRSTREGLEASGFYGNEGSWRPEDVYDS